MPSAGDDHGPTQSDRADDQAGAPPRNRPSVVATILEALPGSLYRVQLDDGRGVLAHVSASLRLTYIRVLPGDQVLVELSPYDRGRGRIVRRLP